MKTILIISLLLLIFTCCTHKTIENKKSKVNQQNNLQIEYSNYDLYNFYDDYNTSKTNYTENKLQIPKKILYILKKIHFNDFKLFNKKEPIPGAINRNGCHDCPNKILNFCIYNDSICFISYVVQPYTEHSVIEFLKFSKKIHYAKLNIFENIKDTFMINDLYSNKLHFNPE